MKRDRDSIQTAFVLGGGGVLGAHEVGMLRALVERGIEPDVVLGTSIGALNGAFYAAEPTSAGVERLSRLWRKRNPTGLSPGAMARRVATLARTGTHLQPLEELQQLLRQMLPVAQNEELTLPFQCVAASIERAAEHWFSQGPLADAVLASCAVPGVFPPVRIDDEHFIDGGIVNSIPVGRAMALGARRIYVLQVGRVERPLRPPRWPWDSVAALGGGTRRLRGGAPAQIRSRPEHAARGSRGPPASHRGLGSSRL